MAAVVKPLTENQKVAILNRVERLIATLKTHIGDISKEMYKLEGASDEHYHDIEYEIDGWESFLNME
jgi:hypothetical protein